MTELHHWVTGFQYADSFSTDNESEQKQLPTQFKVKAPFLGMSPDNCYRIWKLLSINQASPISRKVSMQMIGVQTREQYRFWPTGRPQATTLNKLEIRPERYCGRECLELRVSRQS